MPKYLFETRYTAEGDKGLAKEGGVSRRAAVERHLAQVEGKLEAMYFAFGDVDCFIIADLPDNRAAEALTLAVNQSGAVMSKVIVLMSPEELDEAARIRVQFRPPGA